MFGRKLKIPVVLKFQQGQKIRYKPTPTSLATNAKFLMTKGNNTSWIMRRAEDDDWCRMVLASNDQLAPVSENTAEQ